MTRKLRYDEGVKRPGVGGFTIIEVVVALMVMSVATTVVVSLYASANFFERNSRFTKIAASLAEEALTGVQATPSYYEWPELTPGVLTPIPLSEVGKLMASQEPLCPPLLPTAKRSGMREQSDYDRFSVKIMGLLPDVSAAYVEVTALAEWKLEGRDKSFTLTTCIPRSAIKGGE